MTRIIAKLFAVTVIFTALLHVAPVSAASVVWISSTGSDANQCFATQPCMTFSKALTQLYVGGQINCLNSPGPSDYAASTSQSFTVDCAGGVYQVEEPLGAAFYLYGTSQVVKIRNLTISGALTGYPGINVVGSGTLILENCVFENIRGAGLDIEPTGPLNLVMTNSRISNSSSGVLLKPAAGGSVTATFNGVTITDNIGGGIKTDATNGLVSVDISNSTISNNGGNGMNAVGGAGGTNMLNIHNSVIAKNRSAGIQANGTNAAALIDTTLLDTNTAGATSAVGSGRVLTYGNNRIIGTLGSGFTGTVVLQ
jgi:hypothetical protein